MLGETLSGEQAHFELSYSPTNFGRTIFMFFLEPNVVGDILDDSFDHCRRVSLFAKITKSVRFGKIGESVLLGNVSNDSWC